MLIASTYIFVSILLCQCSTAGSAYSNNTGESPLAGSYTGTYNHTNFTLQLNPNGSYNLQWVASGTNGLESGKFSTDEVSEMSFVGSRLSSDGSSSAEEYTCTLTVASPDLTLTCPATSGSYSIAYTKTSS